MAIISEFNQGSINNKSYTTIWTAQQDCIVNITVFNTHASYQCVLQINDFNYIVPANSVFTTTGEAIKSGQLLKGSVIVTNGTSGVTYPANLNTRISGFTV